jgi:hypothetical protein
LRRVASFDKVALFGRISHPVEVASTSKAPSDCRPAAINGHLSPLAETPKTSLAQAGSTFT